MTSSRIRRLALALSLAAGALLAAVAGAAARAGADPAAAVDPPVFVVTGGGWGHGVGMSQWGAYGQARAGRTFDEILRTYYVGTELSASPRTTVRVLMADGAPAAAFTATGDVVVQDGTGRKWRVRDGRVEVPASLSTTLQTTLKPVRVPVALVAPVRVSPTAGVTISFRGVARRGAYVVSASGDGLLVVNELPMEQYLRGVVPGEVPVEWPLEALKAQAVAARTYAVTSLLAGRPYDLYADVRSQVYAGIPAETPSTDRAVRETSGRILTYEGVPARTLYFSSSGGRTQSAADVFGMDAPYLRSVDDPWDVVSPNHAWPTRTFSAAALGKAFGLRSAAADVGPPLDADATARLAAASRRTGPVRVRVVGLDGEAVETTRTEMRARLGLLSTSFRIGVLSLTSVGASTGARGAVGIRGIARGVEGAVLERQRPDGTWQLAKRLRPAPDGTFAADVRPVASTVFRLSGSGVAGPTASVAVPAA